MWILFKLFRFTKEEVYIFNIIKYSRNIQDCLWGKHNNEWDLEEWRRMFNKRLSKLTDINKTNPHHIIEFKKRVLQIAALSVNFLNKLETNKIKNETRIPTNLKEYE